MHTQHRSQAGFGMIFALIGLLVIAAIISMGAYVAYQSSSRHAVTTKTAKTAQTPAANQSGYLNIPELGIRIKLTANIKDAYYEIGKGGDPISAGARLNVRALAAYPGCTPAQGGIAAIGSFQKGDSDPIVGDYATTFPNAPKVGNYYYYIGGNQYDCTDGKASDLYSAAKHEFVNATIEVLPK